MSNDERRLTVMEAHTYTECEDRTNCWAAAFHNTAELESVKEQLAKAEAWIASQQRDRTLVLGVGRVPCDRVGCRLRADRSNGHPECWTCADSDGWPQPLYLADAPYNSANFGGSR